jgi:hypothetical protein
MVRTRNRCARVARRWTGVLLLVVSSVGTAAAAVPAPSVPAEPSPPPIEVFVAPDGRFVTSRLDRDHGRDPTPFLSGVIVSQLDLSVLDAHGRFPDGDVPADSTKKLVRGRPPQETAALSPEEKKAAAPPEPGVHTAIPSAVAATGALLGGIALLVKVLTSFF